MNKVFLSTLLSAVMLCGSCGSNPQADDEKQQNILAGETQQVAISVAGKDRFYHEIVSNGKVQAGRYADVYWNVDGVISKIGISNGHTVQAGQVIAQVDAAKLKNQLESATASLEQSRLQMQDVIIGQGYNPETDSVPQQVRKLAQVKSGFLQAQANYNSALYDYESCILKAPISGIVANLQDHESNLANRSRAFCRIIDQGSLCVECSILESEISLVSTGTKVDISAFSQPDAKWTGRISEINPVVESNGMVRIKAVVDRCQGLYEGMNVSIKIRKDVGEQVAVPKSAIVYRSSRPVVFTAKGGYARWNYVEPSTENSDMVAITSGIQPGDSVIISGNTFLADHTAIKY